MESIHSYFSPICFPSVLWVVPSPLSYALTPLFIPIFCLLQTRMQSLNPDPKARYTSIYGALKRIMHTEGFWRPLRGLNVMMMGAGPAHAMYFACYENMKRTLNDVFSHQGNSHLANGILKAFVWSWEALLSSACSLGLPPRDRRLSSSTVCSGTENSRVT